jgi:hypothetical protein
MKTPNTCHLFLRISNQICIDGLLSLKDRVHALGRNDSLALVLENKGRVLPVEYYDINLLAGHTAAVDDVCLRRLVSARQILLQELKPDILAGVALRPRMAKAFPDIFEPLLNIVVLRTYYWRLRRAGKRQRLQ